MNIICLGVLLAAQRTAEEQGRVYIAKKLRFEADLLVDPFVCMNCGVLRGTVPQGWRSCEDILGASCRPRDLKRIDDAIDGYAQRAGSGDGAPPYDSASLAEIYAPRVQELFDLQSQGYTHAWWKWDRVLRTNRWHGVETA